MKYFYHDGMFWKCLSDFRDKLDKVFWISIGDIQTNELNLWQFSQNSFQSLKVSLSCSSATSHIRKSIGVLLGKFQPIFQSVVLVNTSVTSMLKHYHYQYLLSLSSISIFLTCNQIDQNRFQSNHQIEFLKCKKSNPKSWNQDGQKNRIPNRIFQIKFSIIIGIKIDSPKSICWKKSIGIAIFKSKITKIRVKSNRKSRFQSIFSRPIIDLAKNRDSIWRIW